MLAKLCSITKGAWLRSPRLLEPPGREYPPRPARPAADLGRPLPGHRQDIAPISIADDNILALLHRFKQPTLFTRDEDFFKHRLCHPAYGLVWLDVAPEEAALFIRRVLRHPRFATKASRMGSVIRAHHDGLQFWQKNRPAPQRAGWTATQ